MEDKYSHKRNKSSRKSKKKHSDKSKRKNKHKDKQSKVDHDIITPPLPNKDTAKSIEDLIKKRELLQEELLKIEKTVDNKSNNNMKDNSMGAITSNKRGMHEHENETLKKQKTNESMGGERHTGLYDSEDEESIIEQRRWQRQKLLEKLAPAPPKDDLIKLDKGNDRQVQSNNENKLPKQPIFGKTVPDEKEKGVADMFSEKYDINAANSIPSKLPQDSDNSQLTDNWDDPEGYYNIRVGDLVNDNRYIIKSLLGQGMFANVARAQDKFRSIEVAIKIARNNDLMFRNGLKEIAMLKEISNADPEGKHHCVKLLRHFMHRKHLCIVLESLHMDLRCVMRKYGKNQGLNLKAIVCYSQQLLLALRLLKKIGIIHADIKPDNILVNENKTVLKLCDFGSAEKIEDGEPRPYLVSRYYRAPEIILGAPYGLAVDLWSVACTFYEMTTGRIMFTGSSNNKMLKCFMDIKGKIPNKLIRRGKFKDQHFNYNNNFLLHSKDTVTGREKVSEITNITVTRNLQHELKKYCKNVSACEEKKLVQLKDLLDRMLMLEPNQRIPISECIKHPFIQEPLQ